MISRFGAFGNEPGSGPMSLPTDAREDSARLCLAAEQTRKKKRKHQQKKKRKHQQSLSSYFEDTPGI